MQYLQMIAIGFADTAQHALHCVRLVLGTTGTIHQNCARVIRKDDARMTHHEYSLSSFEQPPRMRTKTVVCTVHLIRNDERIVIEDSTGLEPVGF